MNKDNQPKKTEQSAKTGKKSGKGRRVGQTIGIVLGTILLVTVLTSAIFVGIFMTYVNTSLKGHVEVDMSEYDQKVSTELYYQDPDTKELVMYQTLFGDENRIWVDFDSIPKNLRNATIAIEDKRFESHHGVDWHGTVRAVFRTLTNGNTQGGSTITQQLIKNVTGNNENTVKRKVTEVYRALALEKDYSKDEILEMYLNTIYLGNQCYGVQTASRTYFHKDVSELTLAECACLISITNNPSQYDPLRSDWTREQNRNRQLDVLDAMLAQEKIDQATYDAAKAEEVVFTNGYTNLGNYVGPQEEDEKPAVVSTANNSYFTDEVITDVAEKFVEVFGLTDDPADADGYVRTAFEKAVSKVYNGGYKIYTTQNPKIQDIAESVFENTNYANYTDSKGEPLQAAITIVDPYTGDVVAMVGAVGEKTQNLVDNYAVQKHQVGSSIKPLTVYAPAIDLGASPASIAYNMPVPISGWKDSSGKDSWPKNYGGGGYKGPQSFRSALRNSYNTAAAQILMTYVGVSRSVEYLHLMGIPDKNINADPFGLALGSSGLTPVQMAVAFGTIANKGVYQQPLSFSRIVDSNGNVVVDMHQQQDRHQVFKPSTAYLVVDMLKEAVQSGTGTKAKISSQVVAGKTGTNSDSKGVFFAGMTGWYSGSVWIGHDNYKALSSKATGGNAAAPLWQSFMEKIHKAKNLDSREIIDGTPSDYNLVRVTTCGVSGQLATDACYNDVNGYKTITDYWSADSVPTAYCSMHKSVSVCTESGLLATDYCPSYSVETRGIVLIPRGHPLYDYIDAYGDTIRKYLGEFATLKSTNDIANHICQIHDAYTAAQQPSDLQNIVSDASNLVYTAYQLVGSAPDLSNDTRRQINTAISAVQTLLSLSPIDYTSLEGAVSNLRSQLQAAGLM